MTLIKRFAYDAAMKLAEYTSQERGGQTRLAKTLGVPPQLMYQWVRSVRPVPIERCAAIERATNGAVTRRDLRPDDWHRIWPELAEKEGVDV